MGNEPTVYEVMAAAISHELRDFEKWFIGLATGERTILMLSRMPIVGRALAQHTHAPNSVRLVAGWILNPVVRESPSAKQSEFGTVLQDWGCEGQATMFPLLSPYVCGRGDVDVGFGSAAQVDKYGNCNIVCVGGGTRAEGPASGSNLSTWPLQYFWPGDVGPGS